MWPLCKNLELRGNGVNEIIQTAVKNDIRIEEYLSTSVRSALIQKIGWMVLIELRKFSQCWSMSA